jgi:hypothetical protein
MEEMEKINVDIHRGVYMDIKGNLVDVELGTDDRDGKPAVRLTGPKDDGEFSVAIRMDDPDGCYHLVMLIKNCEYLGEL